MDKVICLLEVLPSTPEPTDVYMANLLLCSLPKELLRQICSYLPCPSALDFLLVCRTTYRDCDDWTVWREIARRDIARHATLVISDMGARDWWKRYVVAAIKAIRALGDWKVQDL